MTMMAKRRWAGFQRQPWRPVALLLLQQVRSGISYMPQLPSFPIYLDERLGLLPVIIATFVSAGQLAGMFVGVVGGVWSDLFSASGCWCWG